MPENKQAPVYDEETLLAMARDVTKRTFEYRDDFNRESIAEKIIKLLDSDIEVSPMVIDGGWGTGKTEFCWKLINLMREKDTHHVMHINAFQADHANDPLLTVLAEVIKAIPEGKKEERSKFRKKALPLLRFGLKTAGKAVVAHVLKQDAGEVKNELDGILQEGANEAIDASVENLLKDHEEADKNLETLQIALESIVKHKPMVLFVDELDRCKPDFAIHMLEVIKHVFDVKGIQFVLVCNTQQLKASINHCYGIAVDAQDYLNKFLKFTFTLPKQCLGVNEQTDASIRYYKDLIKKSSILKPVIPTDHRESVFAFVQHIIKTQNVSLRKVETLVRHLEIYQKLMNNNGVGSNVPFGYSMLRLTGILLFCFKPELATAMVDNKLDAKGLGDFFGEERLTPVAGEYFNPDAHQVILAALGPDCDKNGELFTPTNDSEKKEWDSVKEKFFGYSCSSNNYNKYQHSVIGAIKTLNLSNT